MNFVNDQRYTAIRMAAVLACAAWALMAGGIQVCAAAPFSFLTGELNAAKKTGADHVFIVYHKPSFVKVGHDPLPMDQNPHTVIRKFAKDLNIVVFNSHTHKTEHYLVDGVSYLVLGAGGASQAFDLTANPSPEAELYWKGQNRVEEYNYLQVTVNARTSKE